MTKITKITKPLSTEERKIRSAKIKAGIRYAKMRKRIVNQNDKKSSREMKKVILYVRVSSYEQVGSFVEQEHILRNYCSKHDLNVVAVYHDIASGVSCENFLPGLQSVYEYCNKHRGEIQKVLVASWDRLTRDSMKLKDYMSMFVRVSGVELNAVETSINFSYSTEQYILGLISKEINNKRLTA